MRASDTHVKVDDELPAFRIGHDIGTHRPVISFLVDEVGQGLYRASIYMLKLVLLLILYESTSPVSGRISDLLTAGGEDCATCPCDKEGSGHRFAGDEFLNYKAAGSHMCV